MASRTCCAAHYTPYVVWHAATAVHALAHMVAHRPACCCCRWWLQRSPAQDHFKPNLAFFQDRPFITYETGQMVRSGTLEFLSRQMQGPPQIDTSASGSTSVTRLVEAGLGYGVVPEWSIDQESKQVGKIVLDEMEPMKLWFAHSAFLESNKFIRLLHQACRTTINNHGQ